MNIACVMCVKLRAVPYFHIQGSVLCEKHGKLSDMGAVGTSTRADACCLAGVHTPPSAFKPLPQFRNDVKLVHQFPALALRLVTDVTVLLIGMLFRRNPEFVVDCVGGYVGHKLTIPGKLVKFLVAKETQLV